MINSVRNTVLAVLNKNNYGYISPSDFNLFAKQAQLELFDAYVADYNRQINKENARMSGTGYADVRKGIEEAIEVFLVSANLTHIAANRYSFPSLLTTGDDYYMIDSLYLLDGGGSILSQFDKVSPSMIDLLVLSNLTPPTLMHPAYTAVNNEVVVYPDTISGPNLVKAKYLRYPKDPKWTYITLAGGEPVFSQSQPDYQDFELPIEEETSLVNKILQYAGLSIREIAVAQAAMADEQMNAQQQQ